MNCRADVDLPALTKDGIQFGRDCFRYASSVRATSMNYQCLSLFDASDLKQVIKDYSLDLWNSRS